MTATDRVGALLAEYGQADLSVAHLSCDRHDPDEVRGEVVEEFRRAARPDR